MTPYLGQKVKISFFDQSGAANPSVVYSCSGIVVIDDDGELAVQSKNRLDKVKFLDKLEECTD
jgi:hypothetical protein